MKIEMLAICDAATDYQGRLNVLGVFEGIAAPKTPVVRERCCIVTRLRFGRNEVGPHQLKISLRNSKGVQLMPEMKENFSVKVPPNRASVAVNMVLNLNKLKIEEFGNHEIALSMDETLQGTVPLTVARAMKKQVRGTMNN